MKKIFVLLLSLPVFAFAQNNTNGYTITGDLSGYENGTAVSFLNDDTGNPEKQTEIENGKFRITGSVTEPVFKVLVFGDTPPMIPIFLENSQILVKGDKSSADKMLISGSKSHNEYIEYMTELQPYLSAFQNPSARDAETMQAIEGVADRFIRKNSSSYVTPIVLIQLMQLGSVQKADELYKLVGEGIKKSPLAQYVNSQLQIAKINAIGSVISEFSQADTSGKQVNISSFRGRYVLVDFWASWCRPCRDENPNLVANFEKYKSKNFTVLGVSLDQAKPAWLNAIKMDGLAWTQVSDLKGWGNEVAGKFHITSIPQNILIDPDGKIIAKNIRGEELGRTLEKVLE